jgi:hypothetical protein
MKAGDNAKASLQAALATIALAVVTAGCSARSAPRDIAGTTEIVTATLLESDMKYTFYALLFIGSFRVGMVIFLEVGRSIRVQ